MKKTQIMVFAGWKMVKYYKDLSLCLQLTKVYLEPYQKSRLAFLRDHIIDV